MGMVPLHVVLPKIARAETRVLTVLDRPKLPPDTYGLVELFCVDPGCDCRRVMLNVTSERTGRHLATVNYGFDPRDDMRGPFLDQLNPQSELSLPLLDLVREHLKQDAAYVERLERHYGMVKAALADPKHAAHKSLPAKRSDEEEVDEALGVWTRMAATTGRNDPCPCGATVDGKRRKFKHCCLAPLGTGGLLTGNRRQGRS